MGTGSLEPPGRPSRALPVDQGRGPPRGRDPDTVRVPRRGPQPARQAAVAVRWCLVLLGPPTHRTAEKLPSIAVWAVQAVEEQPPAGGDPIEWMLLNTCAVHTPAAAVERVDWYACRWGIEIFQPHYDSSKPLSLTAA